MSGYYSKTVFGKPIEDVTYEDVKSFCDLQLPEGINLDYKQDLSSSEKFAKTIAAFANTRGGLIIVGVVDNSNDKPLIPALGIDYKEKMELTVTNIILSHIHPPVTPQIHVCPKNSDNKTFLLVDIPESVDAPHWVFNKKHLYIRVAQRTDSGSWEDFANSEQYEWLRNKREKSLDLRWTILNNVDDHFLELIKKPTLGSSTVFRRGDEMHILTRLLKLSCSPAFPQEALIEVPETYDLMDKISIRDYYGTDYRYPTFLSNRRVFQHGTIAFGSIAKPDDYYFTAIETSGMVVHRETVLEEDIGSTGEPIYYLDFYYTSARLEQFFTFVANLYKEIGYNGLLKLNADLNGKSYMELKLSSRGNFPWRYVSQGKNFIWSTEFYVSELENEKSRYEVIKNIIRDLMYMFGYKDFDWKILENFYKSNNRLNL